LVTDAHWIIPPGTIQVTCTASDPDDDDLSYGWSADGGNISGTGKTVNWTAPEEVSIYDITVLVTDAYGASETETVPVSVVTGQPPIIEKLEITKERYGHCYLKPYSSGYYVGKKQMYDIECFVAGAGIEVSYQWSSTGGEISGEGSMISWKAPNVSGKVTIRVIVSDIAENMASKNLLLSVVDCSRCKFGYCPG
jgi:hypothetical protein